MTYDKSLIVRHPAPAPTPLANLLGVLGGLVIGGLLVAMTLPAIVQLVVVIPSCVLAGVLLAKSRVARTESGSTSEAVIRGSDVVLAFVLIFVLVPPIPFALGSRPGGIAIAAAALYLAIETMHRRAWRRREIVLRP